MRSAVRLMMPLAAWSVASLAAAADLQSGLAVGDLVPAFNVVKCGGAVDDGVDIGSQLCYR